MALSSSFYASLVVLGHEKVQIVRKWDRKLRIKLSTKIGTIIEILFGGM